MRVAAEIISLSAEERDNAKAETHNQQETTTLKLSAEHYQQDAETLNCQQERLMLHQQKRTSLTADTDT
ncbi:hypothetical protein Tco_0341356 [Tanacetum coccineum]